MSSSRAGEDTPEAADRDERFLEGGRNTGRDAQVGAGGPSDGGIGWEAEFRALAGELRDLFARGPMAPLSDDRFNELALRVFRFQARHCASYGAYCRRRGRTVDAVDHWSRIPAVPTAAFKHLDLVSGDPDGALLRFRTSGTTRGVARRGVHHVLDPELYSASLLPPFRTHLLPDGVALPILSLLPAPERAPESSLSYMIARVTESYGAEGSGWFVDPETGLDVEALVLALRRAREAGPVLLAGTAFSFVHLLDALGSKTHTLPQGTRIMETGGFKGRSREMPREALYEALERALGVPRAWIVNEYGMTELLSQFYDGVAGAADDPPRVHHGPPWVRTRVLNPVTLEPVGPGESGLLCHYDLANLGSVSAVLTEDLGVAVDGGIRVLGRSTGAEPRGCSIAMDDLLASTGRS